MFPLTISPDFKAKIPSVVVGWITATVHNSQHDEALWRKMRTPQPGSVAKTKRPSQ